MGDYKKGLKRKVAEYKFLIHDLRVEKFVNDIIHFHVTLNTDLEIYNIEQAQALHSEDLHELKTLASEMRKSVQTYSNAVRSFSPDEKIIAVGNDYIEHIQEICELVLNPLWGRFDKVMAFLPEDCRSARSRSHYRNCVRWICGVYYRIEYFYQDLDNKMAYEEFDVGHDIFDFTNNVIYGYVTEKSASRVDIQLENKATAVIGGNKPRFRRMYFNLVMNAVDAMQEKRVGILKIRVYKDEEKVHLQVKDNGVGIFPEKIKHLILEKKSLDGELHSLGFVFVQQTVKEFNGELSIESEVGVGTTITVSMPYIQGRKPSKSPKSKCEKYLVFKLNNNSDQENINYVEKNAEIDEIETESQTEVIETVEKQETVVSPNEEKIDREKYCGELIMDDYKHSKAQYPGSVFAISVNYQNKLDFFTHKPYEKYWNISHEDLSPMFYESTVRGRLEENDNGDIEVILKSPHGVKDYFDLKNHSDSERNADQYKTMMRDEYILIARKLINTGMPQSISASVTNLEKFFENHQETFNSDPFPLEVMSKLKLSTENGE